MDYKIRKFEIDIIEMINKNELPLELKRLVLVEVLAKVSSAAETSISMQLNNKDDKEEEDG